MHLAYLDDSDSKQKNSKWQVMSGIIMEDKTFKLTEVGVSIVPQLLMPTDKLPLFEEFHACELYGGYGVFEGIEQERRFEAISRLLFVLDVAGLSVVYGGVDLEKLRSEIYASADPLDISFRICMNGIHSWADEDVNSRVHAKLGDDVANYAIERATRHVLDGIFEELVILIVDECDKKIKETLQRSYRSLRPSRVLANGQLLSHFHDDMYFGDSRYSIGIQLADLCSYFISRHLQGDDETESFYKMIHPHIVYFQTYPSIAQVSDKHPGTIGASKAISNRE